MQTLKVNPGFLKSKILIPSSKSYANRALIIASLKNHPVTLLHMPSATDVTILVDCLKKVGLKIDENIKVQNSFPACEKDDCVLDVGEGGTTARFLAALLLLGRKQYTLILGERLKTRPWDDFLKIAKDLGAKATLSDNHLTLKGPITFPKELAIDCSKTTQFATAFQMIAPKNCVRPVNMLSSQSYWKMTEHLLEEMEQSDSYSVPLDWSSASYPLAFGALNQSIEFPGLFLDPLQADSKFYSILLQYKSVTSDHLGLKVFSGDKQGDLNFSVADCLDLVPSLAYFLAHITGRHVLSHIGNLVHKESDRLNEVISLLKTFEREAFVDGDSLVIVGHDKKIMSEKNLILPNDHRMVMTGTLFLLHHSGGNIFPSNAVSKSYPDFFKLLQIS